MGCISSEKTNEISFSYNNNSHKLQKKMSFTSNKLCISGTKESLYPSLVNDEVIDIGITIKTKLKRDVFRHYISEITGIGRKFGFLVGDELISLQPTIPLVGKTNAQVIKLFKDVQVGQYMQLVCKRKVIFKVKYAVSIKKVVHYDIVDSESDGSKSETGSVDGSLDIVSHDGRFGSKLIPPCTMIPASVDPSRTANLSSLDGDNHWYISAEKSSSGSIKLKFSDDFDTSDPKFKFDLLKYYNPSAMDNPSVDFYDLYATLIKIYRIGSEESCNFLEIRTIPYRHVTIRNISTTDTGAPKTVKCNEGIAFYQNPIVALSDTSAFESRKIPYYHLAKTKTGRVGLIYTGDRSQSTLLAKPSVLLKERSADL